MTKNTPFLLAILDGLALNPNQEANAFSLANTPCLDSLLKNHPHTTLISYGERVGLPQGQMGNSEVGHLNIGAGRVIEQDLTIINRTAKENTFQNIPAFKKLSESLDKNSGALHLIGLTSPGGVHSELSHLISIINAAILSNIKYIFIHIITDGRDRPRDAAKEDLKPLISAINKIQSDNPNSHITIASLIGRYYAMDRDKRFDRTKKAYDLYVNGIGSVCSNMNQILEENYVKEIFDEFIEPAVFKHNLNRKTTIIDGDSLLFYNFRADRMRQIVSSFILDSFSGFERSSQPKLSSVVSMCEYDQDFPIPALFPPVIINKHFGEIISENNLRQLRIAETEKYPHVTYFFNGGSEIVLNGEERILVPSPRDVPTYDLKPEMSAFELTEKLLSRLNSNEQLDVIILNFANCDMVGHTGKLDAAIKAVETVDSCLDKIIKKILDKNGSALVTADHGNADQMIDYTTHEPHTYHTLHPVPLIFVSNNSSQYKLNSGGALCDIAPTALDILGISKPEEMTGVSLLSTI